MSRKIIRKKTRPEAFEHDLSPEQLSQLRSWCTKKGFAEAVALAQAEWQLQTSMGALSRWYHKDDAEATLAMIASGAAMNREITSAFEQNPAPEMKTLVSMIKTLIMSLQVKGTLDPAMLELANTLFKSALDYLKEEGKTEDRQLARQKFEFDAATACLAKLPELKAVSDKPKLSPEEKARAIQQILFPHQPSTINSQPL